MNHVQLVLIGFLPAIESKTPPHFEQRMIPEDSRTSSFGGILYPQSEQVVVRSNELGSDRRFRMGGV